MTSQGLVQSWTIIVEFSITTQVLCFGDSVDMDMDDSMSSTNYMTKSPSPGCNSMSVDASEESGWTSYIEGFIAENYDVEDSQSSSMVSGSASMSILRSPSKLISKKRKTKANFVDQELEDTACSPVHSPKVNDLNHLYMKSKAMEDRDVSQGYESNQFYNKQLDRANLTSFSQAKEHVSQQAGEGINMGFLETELRRKGLCLVPMSMLLNIS